MDKLKLTHTVFLNRLFIFTLSHSYIKCLLYILYLPIALPRQATMNYQFYVSHCYNTTALAADV